MASGVVAIVGSLLATNCEDDERKELAKLVKEVCKTSDARLSWLLWIDQGPPALLNRWLLYAFVRAFSPTGASLETVLKAGAIAIAASIDALSRPLSDPQPLVKLLSEATWSTQALRVLFNIIQQIEDPRVRQQVLQVAFTVVARLSPDASVDWIQAATELLTLGVTDVWSAVRKDSARAASKIAFQYQSLDQIDAFIESLLKIAISEQWKAQEGALLTVGAMLSTIKVDRITSNATKISRSTAVEMVKGTTVSPAVYHLGERHRGIPQLPRSLAFKLKPTLYMALKHAQVSVRETAAQCLVHYVGVCDESTRILTFQEVMSKLNRLSPPLEHDQSTSTEAQNQASAELLEAAEAEGLLDVLGKLVPHLPVHFLVKHWKLVFPTLERYVMHIASSVRLRSSAVVLALAELAQRDSSNSLVALELLHQMLTALADHRADFGVCWQRLEGRLLSVDLLVGLLGKDHLWRRSMDASLLQLISTPRKASLDSWLPDGMVAQATWTVDEEEEARIKRVVGVKSSSNSIIDKLNAHVVGKKLSSDEMWQRVLSGWLSQTREGFESRQFELRRIARQILPGLVRLFMWCQQVSLLGTTTLVSTTADSKTAADRAVGGWKWSCLRHVLLHAERVRRYSGDSKELQGLISSARTFATELLDSATAHDHNSATVEEPEAVVARVEAVVMASLSFGQTEPGILSIVEELHRAFLDVHANLPDVFHHPSIICCNSASIDASLDRQLSIALVQLLPSIAKNAPTCAQDSKLWCMMERIVLSWLATDDMFRWITIDKHTAQTALLQTLDELLAQTQSEAHVKEDAAFIVRTIEAAVVVAQLKDCASRCLVRIYASLWRCVLSDPTTRIAVKIIKNLALLDSQQRSLQSSKALASQPDSKSDWDDWDGEGDEETAAATEKLQELRPLSSPVDTNEKFPVASELTRALQPPQLDALQSYLDQLLNSDDKSVVSYRQALQSLSSSLVHS